MNGCRRSLHKRPPQYWTLPIIAGFLLAGCTSDESAAPLPSASPPPTSSPHQPDDSAAKRSYVAFIAILDRADSIPEEQRSQKLSLYMTEPQLSKVINRIKEMKGDDITSYGKLNPHVQSIQVNDRHAVIQDCQDSSYAGIMNSRTGEKLNRGIENESVTAYLSKGADGRWRVTKMVSHGKGC